MNPLAKSSQYNDLRFSSRLFLSGLKIDELHSTQIDRKKRIVDRSRQFSCVPRFVPEQSVERAQESDIVDYEVCASSFRHECYRLWARDSAAYSKLQSYNGIYT
jgi:hypothetical protein